MAKKPSKKELALEACLVAWTCSLNCLEEIVDHVAHAKERMWSTA